MKFTLLTIAVYMLFATVSADYTWVDDASSLSRLNDHTDNIQIDFRFPEFYYGDISRYHRAQFGYEDDTYLQWFNDEGISSATLVVYTEAMPAGVPLYYYTSADGVTFTIVPSGSITATSPVFTSDANAWSSRNMTVTLPSGTRYLRVMFDYCSAPCNAHYTPQIGDAVLTFLGTAPIPTTTGSVVSTPVSETIAASPTSPLEESSLLVSSPTIDVSETIPATTSTVTVTVTSTVSETASPTASPTVSGTVSPTFSPTDGGNGGNGAATAGISAVMCILGVFLAVAQF